MEIKSIFKEVDHSSEFDPFEIASNIVRDVRRRRIHQQIIDEPEIQSQTQQTELIEDIPRFKPKEHSVEKAKLFSSKESFVNYFIPLYERALSERNLPTEYAKYLVGQIALESGWGKYPIG